MARSCLQTAAAGRARAEVIRSEWAQLTAEPQHPHGSCLTRASTVQTMDVNYARWMSKDPDAEPEIEDVPRRFRLRWPTRSAVASTAMVSLIVVGGGAFVRSIATPESSAGQAETVETTIAEQHSEPGAASVDDSMSEDSTSASDDSASDVSTSDGSVSDDSSTSDWSAPAGPPPGPRRMDRRELGPPNGMPPSPPMRDRLRDHRDGF